METNDLERTLAAPESPALELFDKALEAHPGLSTLLLILLVFVALGRIQSARLLTVAAFLGLLFHDQLGGVIARVAIRALAIGVVIVEAMFLVRMWLEGLRASVDDATEASGDERRQVQEWCSPESCRSSRSASHRNAAEEADSSTSQASAAGSLPS